MITEKTFIYPKLTMFKLWGTSLAQVSSSKALRTLLAMCLHGHINLDKVQKESTSLKLVEATASLLQLPSNMSRFPLSWPVLEELQALLGFG